MSSRQGAIGRPDDVLAGVPANLEDLVGVRLVAHRVPRGPAARVPRGPAERASTPARSGAQAILAVAPNVRVVDPIPAPR